MVAIKKATLEALILAAKNTYPDEFIALVEAAIVSLMPAIG